MEFFSNTSQFWWFDTFRPCTVCSQAGFGVEMEVSGTALSRVLCGYQEMHRHGGAVSNSDAKELRVM